MNNQFQQTEIEQISNIKNYFSIIESLLFVSGEPLKLREIASIIECNIGFTEDVLNKMTQEYTKEERGIKLININNEYQIVTQPKNSNYIQKLLKINVRQSLSQAALETLSIVAYKQPITRINIDEIRGVKSDSAIVTLLDRKLIKENGRLTVPGRPILYSTTDEFLKKFGYTTIENLPKLEKFEI
jgi:segregation and condensation protein B